MEKLEQNVKFPQLKTSVAAVVLSEAVELATFAGGLRDNRRIVDAPQEKNKYKVANVKEGKSREGTE